LFGKKAVGHINSTILYSIHSLHEWSKYTILFFRWESYFIFQVYC